MTTPPTTEGPKRTAGRKKTTTDVGRQMLNRERRRMAREQAAESQEMVLEYRRQMEMRAQRMEGVDDPTRTTQRAIDRGLIKRISGVLASEDLTFQMFAHPSPDQRSSAWTDFKQIDIRYATFKDAKGEPNYRMIAANLRGLAYHEGGHIRWTVPFRNLVAQATGVDDTNRYDQYHRSWNILEDQRMETAVVSESPSKAKYFLPMVMEHNCPTQRMLAMNYPYIVWRKYLPAKLRRDGRRLFLDTHPSMTDALCTEMEGLIGRYVKATEPKEMLQAVMDFDALWKQYIAPEVPGDESHRGHDARKPEDLTNEMWEVPISPDMEDGDDEGEGAPGQPDSKGKEPGVGTPSDEKGAPTEEATQTVPDDEGEAEGAGEAQGEGDVEGDDGNGESSGDAKAQGGNGAGNSPSESAPSDTMSDTDLFDMLADAEEVRNNDRTLDADERSMYEAAQEYGSLLRTYSPGVENDPELQLRSDNLAYEVENAFQAATMDKAPAWVEQQDRGIVNVLRYTTRKIGEKDFYRQWTDDDQPGHNMAVSVLLDYSGSMIKHAKELSATAYASKQACQRLDIPCTVSLWNWEAMLLWDHNDKADFLPTIKPNGSTNPTAALDDLFAQRLDKALHIVLIMTDGSWGGSAPFVDYRQEGTVFVVVSYDEDRKTANARAEQVMQYGPDVSVGITNLMQIPKVLEQALTDAAMMAR